METSHQTTEQTNGEAAELNFLAQELEFLSGQCQSWLAAREEWPHRAQAVSRWLRNPSALAEPKAQSVAKEVADLLDSVQLELNSEQVTSFAHTFALLIERSKQLPNYRAAGSLYSELHSQLENLTNLLVQLPPALRARVELCLANLESAPIKHWQSITDACQQVENAVQTESFEQLKLAHLHLEQLCAALPVRPVRRQKFSSISGYQRWHVLVVEDASWSQDSIRRVMNMARQRLASQYYLTHEIVADRQTAENQLRHLTARAVGGSRKNTEDTGLIMVLDMGLPNRQGEQVSREEGIALLRTARQSAMNLPILVLTTPSNFLADHATAAEYGVSDYLLKGAESEEQLLNAILEHVTARQQRTVRVSEGTERVVYIDDVEVTLNPALFRTFSIFMDKAPHRVTTQKAVELLAEKYGDFELLPTHQVPVNVNVENIRRLWATAKVKRESAEKQVADFQNERAPYALWRHLLAEMQTDGVNTQNAVEVARFLDSRYGEEKIESLEVSNSKNISKQVSEIWKAITIVFRARGYIEPREEILVGEHTDEGHAYRVVARVQHGEERKLTNEKFGILVVEDDTQNWQKAILQLLQRFGYETRAVACENDAVSVAREFKPDLLCLDLCLPCDSEQQEIPFSPKALDAGLNALERIREFSPSVRALILSDYVDNDVIRSRATQLGIRVQDYVPKRHDVQSPWESELILKVHRIEQEILRQAVLPLPNITYLPYLQFWRERPGYMEVFGEPWHATELEFNLLFALAESGNTPLITEDLFYLVYVKDKHKKRRNLVYNKDEHAKWLNQIVKRLRICIAHDWFGLADYSKKSCSEDERRHARVVARSVLANDAKVGWLLNARVVIHD